MPKRKRGDSISYIRKKIRKLEKKLLKGCRRSSSSSEQSSSEPQGSVYISFTWINVTTHELQLIRFKLGFTVQRLEFILPAVSVLMYIYIKLVTCLGIYLSVVTHFIKLCFLLKLGSRCNVYEFILPTFCVFSSKYLT